MSLDSVLKYRKDFREHHIPKWYSGVLHVAFNATVLLSVAIYLFLKISGPNGLELLIFPMTMVVGNLAVFLIHRYPLHHYYKGLPDYTYRVHTKHHHSFYTQEKIVYDSARDFYILFFPPAVIIGFTLIYLPANYFLLRNFLSPNALYLYLFTSTLYFILYEVLHYISHLPETHWILKIPYFKLMWNHHGTHHNPELMQNYNFNIVFPLFDMIFGTLYRGQKEKK